MADQSSSETRTALFRLPMMTIGWWDSAVSSINRYRLLRASVAVIPVMTHLLRVQLFTKCTPLGTYVKTNAPHNAEAHRWLCRSAAETKASEWRAWLNYYRSPSRPCHTRRMMMALGWSEYRTTYFPKTISRTESGTGAISTGVPILGKSGSNSILPTSSVAIRAAADGLWTAMNSLRRCKSSMASSV